MSNIATNAKGRVVEVEPGLEEEDDVIEVLNMGSDEDEETPREKKGSLDFGAEPDERPTWFKVQTRYLVPETLNHYSLPWEYDSKDRNYLLIKENISQDLQRELFQHTRRMRGESLMQLEPILRPTPSSNPDSDLDSNSRRRRHRVRRSRSPTRSRSSSSHLSLSPSGSDLDPQSSSSSSSALFRVGRRNRREVYEFDDSDYSSPHVRIRNHTLPPVTPYRHYYESHALPRTPYNRYEYHVSPPGSQTRVKDYYRRSRDHNNDKYSPPKDANGASLSLEIDIADRDNFSKPDLSTKKTIDLAKDDFHLRDRLHLQGLIKASIMTARQSAAEDDTFGAILEYLDGPKYLPDSHFRWIHAQMPKLSLAQYERFIERSSELGKEEQTLIRALLREATVMTRSGALPFFKVKRADAKKTGIVVEPVKWAILMSMQYLTRTPSGQEEGHSIPFTKHQHPLEAVDTLHRQDRIISIHRSSPVHDINVVRFSAVLTSSGSLITFSSESFIDLCQAPLSITELETPPRKVRMHTPDGKEFHFPLKLCETHFALIRAVTTACGKRYSENHKDYAVFNEPGQQIEAADWEQYCIAQSGPWVDVWIRHLPTEPVVIPILRDDQHYRGSRSRVYHPRAAAASDGSYIDMPEVTGRHVYQHRTKSSAIRGKSGHYREPTLSKYGVKVAPQHSRTQDLGVTNRKLPSDSNIVTNQTVHRQNTDGLLFRKSRPSKQSAAGSALHTTKFPESKQNFENGAPSTEARPPQSTSVHVPPFFQWSLGDTESMTEAQAGTRSLEDLNYVLTEVNTLLSRGRLGKNDGRESREHLVKIYKAHEALYDSKKTEETIEAGLNCHQPIDTNNEDVVSKASWQDLLYEVIRRWDTIVCSFCPVEYDHIILKSFKNSRTAFFEDIRSIFDADYVRTSSAAQRQHELGELKESACFIFDYMEVLDDRTAAPSPLSPEITLEGCKDCQWTNDEWPIYVNQKAAISHLRERHFRSGKVPVVELEHYVVPARYLNGVTKCIVAQYLMMSVLGSLGEAKNLINEIQNGVTESFESNRPYRLPRSLVNAFRQFVGGVVYATAAGNAIKRLTELGSEYTSPGKRELAREMERVSKSGTSLESALSSAKHDLILQSQTTDYSTAVSYRVVDSPYILVNILASLIGRSYSADALNLSDAYKDYIDLLRSSMRRNPGKRLHSDIVRLSEEVGTIRKLMVQQTELLSSLLQVLKPESFAVTTKQRQKQYKLEEAATSSIQRRLDEEIMTLEYLKLELGRLTDENIQAFGIQQDDHGKAILVFTTVTVIFLPLSFATGFLGMNTADIRGMGSTQWLFWAIAIPLTCFTMTVVVIVGYHGEQIREILAGIIERLRPIRTHNSQTNSSATDKSDHVVEIGRARQMGLQQEV